MRKQLQQVSLETGNRVAWLAVAVIVAFCAGWVVRAASTACWTFAGV